MRPVANSPSAKTASDRPLVDDMTSPEETTIDKSPERIRRMFAEIAGRYDFLNHLLSLNVDRYWRWRTVRLMRPKPQDRILDVCTGTGDLALAFQRVQSFQQKRACQQKGGSPTAAACQQAQEVVANPQIVASDFCHEMLVIGRRKAQQAGVADNIQFIEADTQNLPLPDNQFQIVCVAFGLRNVTDTDRGLAEMARVCAPGGRVAVLEFSSPQNQPWKATYQWYFQHVLPRIGQFLARNQREAYRYLPQSVGQFPQGEQLAARFRAVGLTQVGYRCLTLGIATLYIGTKP
jgi:demethylmenaquinone methyltransferase/2-methoxy-6-polyprenyl-1,4-benzoquinol methylase